MKRREKRGSKEWDERDKMMGGKNRGGRNGEVKKYEMEGIKTGKVRSVRGREKGRKEEGKTIRMIGKESKLVKKKKLRAE